METDSSAAQALTEDERKKIKENQYEENQFRKSLSRLLSGDTKIASKPLLVGVTPNAIDCCIDSKGLDLVITKSVIMKCMHTETRDELGRQTRKSGHGLTEQLLNDIVWAIKRPVMVIKGSKPESIAVMTDLLDSEDRFIFAFISINQESAIARVNKISSIYGRNNLINYLEECYVKGKIIAVNKEKVNDVRLSIGGHFSKATAPINFDNTIAYTLKSVKYDIQGSRKTMSRIWNLEKYKDNSAVIDEYDNEMTYGELEKQADILADKVGKRCLVFSLCHNALGSLLGYIAFLNNGIVPVMVNAHLEELLLENLLDTYQPEFLWLPKDQIELFKGMETCYEAYGYALLKTDYSTIYPLYEELALLITTSGSTGSPKLVRQSYTNILDNAKSIAEYLKLNETERPITTLPMNYVYGLSIINSHFLVGATMLLTDKGLMQKEFWNFFKEAGATSFGGVPYTYEMLDKLRFYRMDLPSLRTMTQAGGKITPELHEKFAAFAAEKGKNFVVMYGASEATSRMGYLPPERAVEKKGSMGIPIPGGKFTLIDVDGKEITEPLTTGELVYEGKNVTLGYAESGRDLIKGDERNGRLETGDMAQFDKDGFYYIVGRKKRFLKIYGNRVNLDEIDRMIKGKYSVEVASAGIDDHMYIFLTDNKYSDEVREYIIDKTKLNPAAFKVIVIDEIPKNDSGKTRYTELEKYYTT